MADLIAITDDDALNRKTARTILEKNGYDTICFNSGEELLKYIAKNNQPDLILLDIHMDGINGLKTMRLLQELDEGNNVPVIILTSDDNEQTKTEAFACGAMDYIEKPFIPSILLLRARNAMKLFRLQKDLKDQVRLKTEEVIKEHERNERLSLEVVTALAETIDAKDKYTRGHSVRVANYSREIAVRAGFDKQRCNDIYMMGLLHDIGKIGIGGSIINKPSGLTDEEYDIMKTHPNIGYEILKNITEMPMLKFGAKYHHERFDGKGYPEGLKGYAIPEEARIIAVADAYDAMASHRSYHTVADQEFVRSELIKGSGTQFDPKFAMIMVEIINEDTTYSLHEIEDDAPDTHHPQIQTQPEPEPEPEQIRNDDFNSEENEKKAIAMLEEYGFDTDTALYYCMDDMSFYFESLSDLADHAPFIKEQAASSIDFKSLELKDRKTYHNCVHSLKSTAKRIGANKLSKLAKDLEDATTENIYTAGSDHKLIASHNELMECLEEVTDLIEKALATAYSH